MPKSPSKDREAGKPDKPVKSANGTRPPRPPKADRAPERVADRPDKIAKRRPTPAFPKKNQPPTAAAFAARLPLSLGKRFDQVRSYLLKQEDVREDVFFYGPETGWALRYLVGARPLCSLHIHDEQPIGIVSLEPAAAAGVDWRGLSPAGQKARKQAHGSPSLLWLDVELEGNGASDFRSIVRAKLAALQEPEAGAG